MSLFYAGLSAMSAAQSKGLQEVPEVSHNLVVDGIPVVVVDKVDGLARGADGGASGGGGTAAAVAAPAGQPRLLIEVLEGGSLSIPAGVAADSGAVVDAAAEGVLEAGAAEPVA